MSSSTLSRHEMDYNRAQPEDLFKTCPAGRAHYAWGGRSHAFLAGRGEPDSIGPPVGRDHASAEQREAPKRSSPQDRYTHHEVVAPRAVGPSGRTSLINTRLFHKTREAIEPPSSNDSAYPCNQAASFVKRSRRSAGIRCCTKSPRKPGSGVATATRTHSSAEKAMPAIATASSEIATACVWLRRR